MVPKEHSNRGRKRARQAREALGLDPVAPLVCVVSTVEAQVPVFVGDLPVYVSGAYKPDIPMVYVNRTHAVVRQRFTVAHEFGHHFIGHRAAKIIDSPATLSDTTRDPQEIEANAFAAELLVPRAGVADWWASRGDHVGLEAVCLMAHHYGVSAYVALYSLTGAGVLDWNAGKRLEAELNDDLHAEVIARLDLPPRDDELQRVQLAEATRLPAVWRGTLLERLVDRDIGVIRAARTAGQPPAALLKALEHLTL